MFRVYLIQNIIMNTEKTLAEPSQGIRVIKKNIREVLELSNILKTSLGPMGKDKVIRNSRKNVTITNDGATILGKARIKGEIRKMIAELSMAQDDELGDGTTGVVILTGALLENAEKLLELGIHPARICEGFEHASDLCISYLEKISEVLNHKDMIFSSLVDIAMTAMNSKIINRSKKILAEICVKAVIAVADLKRRDVNLDLIKIEGKIGENLEKTNLINGIILDKEFSNSQMPKKITDARLAILTCPLEPAKPKSKHKIEIEDAKHYEKLEKVEQNYFKEMINQLKKSGVNLIICQWGFDDEANHLLLRNKISAVRWASGSDIELLSISTGAKIVPRFNELTTVCIGHSGKITESSVGSNQDRFLIIEDCPVSNTVTILVRGNSELILEEAKRAIHDSLCAIRNLFKDNRVVLGGGSSEMSCSNFIKNIGEKSLGAKHYILNAFSEALKIIPSVLAENSGYSAIDTVSTLSMIHDNEGGISYGIDGSGFGIGNMKKQKIFETFASKQHQIQTATQMANSILRIDDMIDLKKKDI